MSVCQLRHLRAKREISRASTAPTRPSHTAQAAARIPSVPYPSPIAPDPRQSPPRSSSRVSWPDLQRVLTAAALLLIAHLVWRGLADVDVRREIQMLRRNLAVHNRYPSVQSAVVNVDVK